MHPLTVGPRWAAQISAIRNAHTEDSNLVRWGNNFYRVCRSPGSPFQVELTAGGGSIVLDFDSKDFYVKLIAGRPFGRYSSLLPDQRVSFLRMVHAVHTLASGKLDFDLQSLVVFCVAESIRNDHLATALSQAFTTSFTQIRGVSPELPLLPWWQLAHQWGQTCDAIYAAISPEMRNALPQPRAALSEQQRRLSEYIAPQRLRSDLGLSARTTAVLKRPT